jgi:hypothetical protein
VAGGSLAMQQNSRADDYRERGVQARQHASQATDPKLKEAWKVLADNWFAMAERAELMEKRHREPPAKD